jgi:hypothetical protein
MSGGKNETGPRDREKAKNYGVFGEFLVRKITSFSVDLSLQGEISPLI